MESLFESLLPLPLYRKLRVDKMALPADIRAARQRLAQAVDNLGTCRLSDTERDRLEVPTLDDWYRMGRSTMLHRFDYLLDSSARREADKRYTLITKEDFKQVEEACHAVDSMAFNASQIERVRDDGVLAADLLLTHALQRIAAAVEARLATHQQAQGGVPEALPEARSAALPEARSAALSARWTRISAPPATPAGAEQPPPPPTPLHAAVLQEQDQDSDHTDTDRPDSEGPEEPGDEPRRDLLALAALIQGEALRKRTIELTTMVSALGVPYLKPWSIGNDERQRAQQEEYEQLKQEVKPHAAVTAQAVLDELLPAEPWLEEASGVSRAALELALSWREELDGLLTLRDRILQDMQDTDRVVWSRGRYLMRTVLHDAAVFINRCDQTDKDGGTARRMVLFDLEMTLREMHRTPPPRLVREWIRKRRSQNEIRWRFRLGLSLLYRAPQWEQGEQAAQASPAPQAHAPGGPPA